MLGHFTVAAYTWRRMQVRVTSTRSRCRVVNDIYWSAGHCLAGCITLMRRTVTPEPVNMLACTVVSIQCSAIARSAEGLLESLSSLTRSRYMPITFCLTAESVPPQQQQQHHELGGSCISWASTLTCSTCFQLLPACLAPA